MKDRRKARLRGRKVTSYILNTIIYTSMFFVTLWKASDVLSIIGSIIIAAILLNTAIFIGGNTFDKITNLKYFNKDKD
jgi:hypothetical protein